MSRYLWSVATGNVNPLVKKSRKASEYITSLEGFVAVHPTPDYTGTHWFFDTENNAKGARNMMRAKGIHCGDNICRFKWDGGAVIEFDDPKYRK